MSEPDLSTEDTADTGEDRYLVFRIGQETLAAPLLSIREIVAPLPYTIVPNPFNYYLGLANLRGQMLGVLDMGLRLGMKPVAAEGEGAFLVFDLDGAAMAAFVNGVDSVIAIAKKDIVQNETINMMIPTQALRGIAQTPQRLLPIVHLAGFVETLESV